MLYVNGSINSLSGVVNDYTALDITAYNNINVTGNVTYKTEPVTLTASGSTPVHSLVPNSNTGQSLGLFTNNGSVQCGSGSIRE